VIWTYVTALMKISILLSIGAQILDADPRLRGQYVGRTTGMRYSRLYPRLARWQQARRR
jgi:hypothetical protein